ncbi:MAG: cell envelope-related transcriptional attenuator, partial [uncultured bacterium]
GEEASSGAGIRFAEASILETLGQPVNYTVIVNFNLFKQVIDLVGGVDINVSPGFEDKEYPLPGKEKSQPVSSRYETISFSDGANHLNGDTALKFVRSRHSVGDEGTDFARSRRQQQIIGALKDKIFNKDFLLNQEKMTKLVDLIQDNLITNLPSSLYPVLARLGLDQAGKNINTIPLSILPDSEGVSILYNPPVNKFKGEWVLMPKDNNWKALKQYIDSHLYSTLIK